MANEIPKRYLLTEGERQAQVAEAERQLRAAMAAHPEQRGIYEDAIARLKAREKPKLDLCRF